MFFTTESHFGYDKAQTNYLFKTSFSTLVAGLYALYNKKYEFSLMANLCWLSSINYWRDPMPGWRRNVDIIFVVTSLMNQYAKAYKYQYAHIYYPLITLSASCYPISIYYYNNNKIWCSVYFHSGVHIFANLANIILYHGKRITE